MEPTKAPASSSLKERIKLNKVLTFSPKTGNLIGVNPNREREMPSPREAVLLNQSRAASSRAVLSAKFDKFRKSQGNFISKRQISSGGYSATQRQGGAGYSSNMAFNMTYKTATVAASLAQSNILSPRSPKQRTHRNLQNPRFNKLNMNPLSSHRDKYDRQAASSRDPNLNFTSSVNNVNIS